MFVYIMTNRPRGVLYTGVTNELIRRVYEHKMKITGGFTVHYRCDKLVYFEDRPDPLDAIAREKSVKRWKFELVESMNSDWIDLYPTLLG